MQVTSSQGSAEGAEKMPEAHPSAGTRFKVGYRPCCCPASALMVEVETTLALGSGGYSSCSA